jgi:hypothetical protein
MFFDLMSGLMLGQMLGLPLGPMLALIPPAYSLITLN